MASFKDNNGKTWILALDGPTIKTVRSECDVDLAAQDGSAFQKLSEDPCLLVDVLWVLCREQAEGQTDRQFGKALVGDAIENATAAMLESIADFFPKSRAKLLRAIVAKDRQATELATEKALQRINDPQLTARVVAALERQMDERLRDAMTRLTGATDTPDSSASPHAA